MENNPFDYDLAIVGGGIAGVTLASALKNSGLKVAIIESQTKEQASSRKQAYALTLLSGQIFQGIGIWEKIFPAIGKFSHIRLSDEDYPEIVRFHREELDTEFLGYVGEHNVILSALQEFVSDAPNIHWLCPAEVVGIEYLPQMAQVQVKIGQQTETITTKLVVGADGARSQVRQRVGIKTRGWKYWQSCVAFTIRHQLPENNTAFERFRATGPMGILPLPGNRCQIVWTAPHAQAKELHQLPEQAFLERLQRHIGGLLGELELVGERFLYPVQLMQCDRYVQPRLALVGDAAHCCHPVGGQGLNLGIRDVAALTEVLQQAHQQGEDIGSLNILCRYEKWRKKENLTILGFTDFLDRTFSNNLLPIVAVRRLGLWLLNHIPLGKNFALKLMTGLKGKTPQLAQ